MILQSTEVQFFAATTLHMKLLKFWKEVPKEKYMELKEKIFEVIFKFSNGPPLVLNRLCIAVSIRHFCKKINNYIKYLSF